jgi:hypothetical protein
LHDAVDQGASLRDVGDENFIDQGQSSDWFFCLVQPDQRMGNIQVLTPRRGSLLCHITGSCLAVKDIPTKHLPVEASKCTTTVVVD